MKAELIEGEFISTIYQDAVFNYVVYVPYACKNKGNCALFVMHDGLNEEEALATERLIETGEMPPCIILAVKTGTLPLKINGAYDRWLRMNTYDVFGTRYPNFLVEELIPHIVEKYGLRISENADMHMISGGSSGGVSSWNVVWHRTDYFHRVYMSSPSFLAMGEGERLVTLMRKFETKPIRVYTDFSENEPDDYFGSSYCVADAAVRALRFANYDMQWEYHPNEGHCSRYRDYEAALKRLRFLWEDWENKPITLSSFSTRVEKIISVQEPWQRTGLAFPEKIEAISDGKFFQRGKYRIGKEKIVFETEEKNLEFAFEGSDVSALCLSSDKGRLYIGDKNKSVVYAMTVLPDGSLQAPYILATLHNNIEYRHIGAYDMCVDAEDRVYVATELGIQCIRSFGLIDAIIENPCGQVPKKLEIGLDGYLYAETEEGIYRRKLVDKKPACINEQTQPKQTEYYN